MTYVKEREYIVAYDDEGKYVGKWNILTGEFYGMKGTVVKKTPMAFTATQLEQAMAMGGIHDKINACAVDLYRTFNFYYIHAKPWTYYSNRLEQVISVGLRVDSHLKLAFDFKLNKDIIRYIQRYFDGWFSQAHYNTAIIELQHGEYLEGKSLAFRTAFRDAILIHHMPINFVKAFLNRCELEKIMPFVEDYMRSSLGMFIADYYDKSVAMWGSAKVEPNLLSNYARICALYKQYMEENRDAVLKRNNDLDWLYFSNSEYRAVPLITAEEFHEEAEAQHNCVERIYMEKVMNGQTHVVVVRKVSDPERSVITCEVNNQGRIIQYLGFANSRDLTESQFAFKELYAEHLSNNVK